MTHSFNSDSIVIVDGFVNLVDAQSWYLKDGEWIVREWYLPTGGFRREVVQYRSNMKSMGEKRILFTTNPSLKDVPQLPELVEDVGEMAWKACDSEMTVGVNTNGEASMFREGYLQGYKAASKKQFTSEDIENAFYAGRKSREDLGYTAADYIASLPKQIPSELTIEVDKDNNVTIKHIKF